MRLRRRRPLMCACGHTELLHMALHRQCLAALGNGSDVERRLSDLCGDVPGGCRVFRAVLDPTPPLHARWRLRWRTWRRNAAAQLTGRPERWG